MSCGYCFPFCCSEACGGAPPEGTSSENVDLAKVVGFVDRAYAYASAALQQSSAALQKSTDALASVHRSIFPSKPPPVAVDALAAPFEGDATTMATTRVLRRYAAPSSLSSYFLVTKSSVILRKS